MSNCDCIQGFQFGNQCMATTVHCMFEFRCRMQILLIDVDLVAPVVENSAKLSQFSPASHYITVKLHLQLQFSTSTGLKKLSVTKVKGSCMCSQLSAMSWTCCKIFLTRSILCNIVLVLLLQNLLLATHLAINAILKGSQVWNCYTEKCQCTLKAIYTNQKLDR